jgi:hypothetical protein
VKCASRTFRILQSFEVGEKVGLVFLLEHVGIGGHAVAAFVDDFAPTVASEGALPFFIFAFL